MIPCSLVATYCLQIPCSSQTLIIIYQAIRRHSPGAHSINFFYMQCTTLNITYDRIVRTDKIRTIGCKRKNFCSNVTNYITYVSTPCQQFVATVTCKCVVKMINLIWNFIYIYKDPKNVYILYNVGGSWSLYYFLSLDFFITIPITRNYIHSQWSLTLLLVYTIIIVTRSWLQSLITFLHVYTGWLLSYQLASNYHTLPVSVSYRDLTRRTAPYKLTLYRRGPSGYSLCTDTPKTVAILLSCVSDILATVIGFFCWRLRGDEP
jgi:hypothetical protein